MALHPVGPHPASTYWRRRAGVLVGLLVLVLVLKSCASGADAPKRTSAKPTPSPTATVARTPSPKPSTATAPLCGDGAITLITETDAETYAVGGSPKITMTVKNTSAAACRRDLGSKAVELLVFSGTDRIWSSDDCSTGTSASVITLPAGGSQTVTKTWPGKRSLPGCAGSKAAAAAGTYKVVGRVGTLRKDGSVFRLHA